MSTALRNRYVSATFKERRSILAGELRQLEQEMRTKAEALAHVDAVLAMYAPEVDVRTLPVRRPRSNTTYAVPDLSRRIRDVLRRRSVPIAASDVVGAIVCSAAIKVRRRVNQDETRRCAAA